MEYIRITGRHCYETKNANKFLKIIGAEAVVLTLIAISSSTFILVSNKPPSLSYIITPVLLQVIFTIYCSKTTYNGQSGFTRKCR